MHLPQGLKRLGYSTHISGKWHIGEQYPTHPRGQGFVEFFGFCGGLWNNYFDATLERATMETLYHASRLASIGEMAAGIAHEINNPLTTIIGLTSLLLDTALPDGLEEETQEDLQMINKEARRARDIVRSLLNFARAGLPRRQPTDFNQLIEEAIFLVYTKSVSQKVVLEKWLNPLPQMLLDINQMKQVIVNLLNNAVQSMLVDADASVLPSPSAGMLAARTTWAICSRIFGSRSESVRCVQWSSTGERRLLHDRAR